MNADTVVSDDDYIAALLDLIVSSFEDDKADDLTVIDLKGKTDVADHMVVASGRSSTHCKAMADHVLFKLKHRGTPALSYAGQEAGDWIAIDCVDVLVHVFRPEVRAFYRLEEMWEGDFERNVASITAEEFGHEEIDSDDLDLEELAEDELVSKE